MEETMIKNANINRIGLCGVRFRACIQYNHTDVCYVTSSSINWTEVTKPAANHMGTRVM